MEDASPKDSAASCTVLLVRHGETVDNVKGLYAGVRDSALTSHGVQQAQRLGQYLAKQGCRITHLFSSNLSRAVKTADLLRSVQEQPHELEPVQLACLREQDFGFFEGKPFHVRSATGKSGKDNQRQKHKESPDFQDVESKESLKRRCTEFYDQHLVPILGQATREKRVVVVVSHGILLSTLWKVLIAQQPANSISLAPELKSGSYPDQSLDHIASWSNTGYLDLTLTRRAASAGVDVEGPAFDLRVNQANNRDHLTGLKRTRGGVGSAEYDKNQRSIDTFFKKPRLG
ncbi:MAG: hypothetical protein Q9162_000569 [Coniocarpon cinnabarinum]